MHTKTVILLICSMVVLITGTIDVIPPQPTNAPPTTIKPTTIKPTTTKPTNSTTTKPTNSTTTKPTVITTTKPTSTSITTTTAKPTTEKPTIPTSTAKPVPPVGPPINNYSANYTNSAIYCLNIIAALQIESLGNNSQRIDVPANTMGLGSCGNTTETMTVAWGNYGIDFNLEKTSNQYQVSNISVTFNGTILRHNKTEFATLLSQSYLCDKNQSLDLTNSNNTVVAKLHLSHLKYQAFMNNTNNKFSSAWDCSYTGTSDVVPIVVGCVLAILVVLVLAAYLYGRKHWSQNQYLSMFSNEGNESDYIPMKTLSCFN